jgi:site-specific recombinase XerC
VICGERGCASTKHSRSPRPISISAAARCSSDAARAAGAARSACAWGWDELQPWLDIRLELPVGPLSCVINGLTRDQHWSCAAARADLRTTAVRAGVRRRSASHQRRHAHAVELAREGVPLIVIQRQLGHSNLGITSIYLQGIDNAEIIETVHARRQPMSR